MATLLAGAPIHPDRVQLSTLRENRLRMHHNNPFRRRSWRLLVGGLGIFFAAAVSASDVFERIPFETGTKAAQPSITVDPTQGFVVTWQEQASDGNALRFAVLDTTGREVRRGLVSSGANRFINSADFPSLAVLDNGDWVTFWLQKTASGTYAYEIRTVRSRDKGVTWDAAVVAHRDGTPTEHGFVSMVPAGGDKARLIWLDGRRMATTADAHGEGGDEHMTLRTALLARTGVPTDERELDSLTCACCQTDMVRGSSRTAAVYRDRTDNEIRDIGIVMLETDAREPSIVHADAWTMPGCPVNGPALAARGERFLTAWPTMAKGPMEVRISIGDGTSFGTPRTLGKGDSETGRVDAAALANGWLVSRVTTQERKPALTLTWLSTDGSTVAEEQAAGPVGGYPRMAVDGDAVIIVFTEPAGEGNSRVGVLRGTGRSGIAVTRSN